ncbi:hypothetical protein [Nitratireductor indicus]|uniref:hypothetical protein n=1 Tax=Nitratireductor indicus TaxID=721133 RepID=UPI0028762CE9|nr:hypothetical protein [Nitratireductor indicus]MDS1136662.1 hypothetical protein [Nitratireductor indicus]
MWDFSVTNAFRLMAATTPFLLFRAMVYFGIAVAYVLATGVGAGVGYGIGGFAGPDDQAGYAIWGGGIGFSLTAGVLYFLREYILYTVKAAHIAVLVEKMDGRPLPEGRGQVAYGASVVRERFAQASVLFAVDQLVKGVIRAITGLVQGILSFLPIPGLDNIARILRAFLNVAVGFIDEVILAHAIRTRSDNAWASAREALVLYGQNHKAMLKNAAFLAVIVYGLSFLVFLVMLAPAAAVVYLMPGAWSAGGMIFALLFAWAVKAALIEPFAITCMMQVFFKVTEGQVPDPAWDAKLEQMSGKFRELKDKAVGAMGGRPAGGQQGPGAAGHEGAL